MPPLLSICIPTWNRADSLRKTLGSLVAALPGLPAGSIELCLSDNASTDATPLVIAEARNLGIPVRTTRLAENAGFSGNYWSVASLATARFTWITGDDDAFDPEGLAALVTSLATLSGDLILINSSPWKAGAKSLPDQEINGLEGYFATLGIFHASFIGNSVYSTVSLRPFIGHPATLASAYPHMAPVFGLLHSGRCRFVNLRPVTMDDSSRSWRARQPLLTSIDMARLASDLAFTDSACRLATRARTYILLMRSLPRAVLRVSRRIITVDSANPYQSLDCRNILDCYREVPLAGTAACIAAFLTRIAALLLSGKSRCL